MADDAALPEPSGLWAVVEHTPAGHPDEPCYLVKAPYPLGGPLWWSIGGEDGWGWDQVTGWPGTLRWVRGGLEA